ncbi:MAG: nitroreductase [Gammaproteobacteria bacterium]|nr:nitroreductase [Gammaproteobacteria bacterium]
MPDPNLNVRDARMIDFLLSRRSVVADLIGEPGPTEAELRDILSAAMRVPDHGKLAPWRFVLIRGRAREELGVIMGEAFRQENPDLHERYVEREQKRFSRVPIVVAVISQVTKDHKTPEWEQVLSAGAACQTMLIAALSMGFAAQWITEWYAYNAKVCDALKLKNDDRIAGFVYIGTAQAIADRDRPNYDDVVSEWQVSQ